VGLTASQKSLYEKVRQLGSGNQAVQLTDDACRAVLGIAARDLGFDAHLSMDATALPELFAANPPSTLRVDGPAPVALLEDFLAAGPPDSDTYFSCLAALHKGRLKYERILATQPVPTLDQVGPRGLLQYGALPTPALTGFLFWRKWMFDIDNRAGQETGYLFEPILAAAIGGVPASAAKSPVRRRANTSKGRQVDCIRDQTAYEFKLRVTIAASGQGRWGEELDFPQDCRASEFTPVLVVFDPTDNPKLNELVEAFEEAGGCAYVGDDAWGHLEDEAGYTMAAFIEKYVRSPLRDLLDVAPVGMPKLQLEMSAERVVFAVDGHESEIRRTGEDPDLASNGDDIPDDAADQLPGV